MRDTSHAPHRLAAIGLGVKHSHILVLLHGESFTRKSHHSLARPASSNSNSNHRQDAGWILPDGALPLVPSSGHAGAPRLQPKAAAGGGGQWVQGLLSMLRVPLQVKDAAATEAQNITAAMSLTVALATAAGAGGALPPQLLSIVSSFRSVNGGL